MLENPKTSAAVAVAVLGFIYGTYTYRGALRNVTSYANPFHWFGKKHAGVMPVPTQENQKSSVQKDQKKKELKRGGVRVSGIDHFFLLDR
jgi:hypothetical protein